MAYGQCGSEARAAEEKCSTYYAEDLSEGTFYQCRWLSGTGKSGREVNVCVTWSAENREMNLCSSNKPEIVEMFFKLVMTGHAIQNVAMPEVAMPERLDTI